MSRASIIIPVYNSEEFICSAVESALAQRYKDKEVIVVDDGSTDGTCKALGPYREKGEITYIRQENSGPSGARNAGFLNAGGCSMTFLDADDILDADYLPSVTAFLEDYPMVDFVFTNYEVFNNHEVVSRSGVDRWKAFRSIPHVKLGQRKRIFLESLTKYIIGYGGFMTTSCVTIRRRRLDREGMFRTGYFYGEDDEFFARINYTCKAGYIDRVLLRKRSHAGSLSHDREKILRNVSHFIGLAEIQKSYFSRDREIQDILRRKIPALVFDYCWHLIDRKRFGEAQDVLCRYLKQYKKALPLYKLLVKSYLSGLYCQSGS